ncbi:hypothetical protein QVD17_01624 [Tagetes erecta]|uniref:Flavonoid 3'-hydroxylase n=1 Tax=Tagetes erecta TaxID=13708 RepID=A0AAD8L7K2_TARER|nr:hypothetical protein QVD17_01624 [Tagetes erecta]
MLILTSLLYTLITALVLCYGLLNLRPRHHKRLPPGPTPWPIVGNLPHLGTIPHQSLGALAKKYGPLVYLRLGFIDVVAVASGSAAIQFLKVHDMNFASRPPTSGAKHMAYNYHDLVFAPYGPRWRMLRKICAVNIFSAKALANSHHIRQEEVAILTRALVGAEGSAVKLSEHVNVCTTNALARVLVGKKIFGNNDPKADEFKEKVIELMVLGGEANIGDFIPALDWMDLQAGTKRMKKLQLWFDSFFNTIFQQHKTHNGGESGHVDLLTTLMHEGDREGRKLSDIEIKALFLNLFTAGTDPANTTVEWALAQLIRHPRVLKQAQEEMDTIVGRDRLVTELDLSQLTFIQATVKEIFRLHPGTPLSIPRIASQSCEIDGYYIPKGSTILFNLWAIARDPKIWTDPLEFRPTRFLPGGEKPNADIRGHDFDIMPFGAGRRMCVGMNLGLRMVQLLVATLVQAFDWELANGLETHKLNMDEASGLTLQRAEPLMVHPKPRLARHVYESA